MYAEAREKPSISYGLGAGAQVTDFKFWIIAGELTGQGVCSRVGGMSEEQLKLTGAWLKTPLGRWCLAAEQRLVRRVVDTIFGEQFLQIGVWGGADSFLRHARTQRHALVDWRDGVGADMLSEPGRLAIASDSVDAVLLPHTLELTESPHALLREVDRVLRADGHLVTLTFKPGGPWGLRHAFARQGYPPGQRRIIGEGRLRDWLELLSYDVGPRTRYCHALPFESLGRLGRLSEDAWLARWLPLLSGGYLLRARKRVYPLTPIRPVWKRPRLKAVGGLVEPSTRTSQSRIRQ
jgi:SAM-dependent methyltransferase